MVTKIVHHRAIPLLVLLSRITVSLKCFQCTEILKNSRMPCPTSDSTIVATVVASDDTKYHDVGSNSSCVVRSFYNEKHSRTVMMYIVTNVQGVRIWRCFPPGRCPHPHLHGQCHHRPHNGYSMYFNLFQLPTPRSV